MGGVHQALVRVLRGHFSLVARPCTCERRNQCECQQVAPVCVAMLPPRRVGQDRALPVCAERALEAGGGAASAARVAEGRHGPYVFFGDQHAAKVAAAFLKFAASWQFRAAMPGVEPLA